MIRCVRIIGYFIRWNYITLHYIGRAMKRREHVVVERKLNEVDRQLLNPSLTIDVGNASKRVEFSRCKGFLPLYAARFVGSWSVALLLNKSYIVPENK